MVRFYLLLLSVVGFAVTQPTVDEDLPDVERLTNKLELLTETVIDLKMELKQVW